MVRSVAADLARSGALRGLAARIEAVMTVPMTNTARLTTPVLCGRQGFNSTQQLRSLEVGRLCPLCV